MENLFQKISSPSKYFTWYQSICQQAKTRKLPKSVYIETHHILPKSIFPEFDKDPINLVQLTAREHFICHWLLTKLIDDHRIVYAFQMMIPNRTGSRYRPKSSIVYQNLKKKFSLNNVGTAGKSWYTNGTSNIMVSVGDDPPFGYIKGRTFTQQHKDSLKGIQKTEEHKQRQSIAMTGKPGISGEKNPAKRKEVRLKISNARKGSTASDETKLKMKLAKLGKKRGPYKKLSPQRIPNAN